MGRITDEDVARVRDATDLVALINERVLLKPKGRLFWGLCPFHGEKTPSFKVDPATQLWHCFGCGLGGDAFGFVMKIDNVEFPDAVRLLADRANLEIREEEGGVPRGRKERLYAALETAAEYYHRVLTGSRDARPTEARTYLAQRGFGSEVAKSWRLGYAPGRGSLVTHLAEKGFSVEEMVESNLALLGEGGAAKDRFYERIMFPILDLQGRVVGFGGRVLGKGEPKYLNTNDTPVFHKSANMYGIDRAKGAITATGTAIVVEGYTDVIALHEAGITTAVATLGTALTRQHVKLLGRFAKRVVYLFDGDEAGMRAADRAVEFIDKNVTTDAYATRVSLDVAVIPEGRDPADFVTERGREATEQIVERAVPLLRFAIDRRLARWDLDRAEERERALRDAVEVLTPIKDTETGREYAGYVAGKLFTEPRIVLARLAESRNVRVHRDEDEPGTRAASGGLSLSVRTRVELELLGVLVNVGRLRPRARELLAQSLLVDDQHRRMAEVIAESSEAMPPAALAGLLEERVPGSAEALSSSSALQDEGVNADTLVDDLVRRVKEIELERRIAAGKARLREPGAFATPEESDDLFREVSTLQRELDSLRRHAGDM